jgi:hypothetical protein
MIPRLVILAGLLVAASRAEIIDRIAVTVDNQVITASEIVLEIRLTAFLNGDKLDFSPAARRNAADRLIEQKLIRREMEVGRYSAPSSGDVEPMLKAVQEQRFPRSGEYTQALAQYGITEEELNVYLLWQLTLLRFLDIRFRPGVEVTDAQIQSYFDRNRTELEARAGGSRNPTIDDFRDQIRRILTEEGVDRQMDTWLAEARKRSRVEFHEEAFQ